MFFYHSSVAAKTRYEIFNAQKQHIPASMWGHVELP